MSVVKLASDAVGEHAQLAAIMSIAASIPPGAASRRTTHVRRDVPAAHQRDELELSICSAHVPVQAAFASAGTFAVGAAMPLSTGLIPPESFLIPAVAATSLLFLAILGGLAAFSAAQMRGPVRRCVLRFGCARPWRRPLASGHCLT